MIESDGYAKGDLLAYFYPATKQLIDTVIVIEVKELNISTTWHITKPIKEYTLHFTNQRHYFSGVYNEAFFYDKGSYFMRLKDYGDNYG